MTSFQTYDEPRGPQPLKCLCSNTFCAHEERQCPVTGTWNGAPPPGWRQDDRTQLQPLCPDCVRMMDLQDGDTIAVRIPGQYPIYNLMRVVESLGHGRLRVCGFEMPAHLESGSREVVVERFVNLRDLLPPSVDSDLRKGAHVIALQPQGARLAQLLEDHHMQTPALLLRDFGYFDFRAQQEVGQQFTQPPKAIFSVRSYCEAR